MQVYAVYLRHGSVKVQKIIRDGVFKDNFHEINENYFLLRAQNTDATKLSYALGIGPAEDFDDGVSQSGIVFRLSPHYFGYWNRDTWEWIDDAFKDGE